MSLYRRYWILCLCSLLQLIEPLDLIAFYTLFAGMGWGGDEFYNCIKIQHIKYYIEFGKHERWVTVNSETSVKASAS